jgi:membrane protein YqaA with SNARE-associated domain
MSVLEKFRGYRKGWYESIASHARGKYASWWLAGVAFSESSFFLVPPDVLLVALILAQGSRWVYFATVATVSSVAGGLFGYFIGAVAFTYLGEPVIRLYGLQDEFLQVQTFFEEHAFWSIFISAFTPIPYKVFTISAGLFGINIFMFLIASFLGRGLRFYAVAYITERWGNKILTLALRYFNIASIIVVALIILYVYLKS